MAPLYITLNSIPDIVTQPTLRDIDFLCEGTFHNNATMKCCQHPQLFIGRGKFLYLQKRFLSQHNYTFLTRKHIIIVLLHS